jgi:hypothetical protein
MQVKTAILFKLLLVAGLSCFECDFELSLNHMGSWIYFVHKNSWFLNVKDTLTTDLSFRTKGTKVGIELRTIEF